MSRIPKWLGDTIEKVFSGFVHPVYVSRTEMIAPGLKRILFEGDLRPVRLVPGNVFKFRVTSNDYRHYTPSHFNTETGFCELLVYLHGEGPGSAWARDLRPGQEVLLMGPGGRLHLDPLKQYHFLFGDETSLGLMLCMKEAILPQQKDYLCLTELEPPHLDWPSLLGISADTVPKTPDNPGSHACSYIENLEGKCWDTWKNAVFYLTGRARSIQAVRKTLLARGVSPKQIRAEPYWETGKKGL